MPNWKKKKSFIFSVIYITAKIYISSDVQKFNDLKDFEEIMWNYNVIESRKIEMIFVIVS